MMHKQIKSVIGFIIGVAVSLLCLYWLFLKHMSSTKAICFSLMLSIILCLALAYSKNLKCLTLLITLKVFSKQGRSMLTAYIFALTLLGPTANIIENIGVISDSLECSEEKIQDVFRELQDLIMQPVKAIEKIIKEGAKKIEEICQKFVKILNKFKNLIMKIVKNIKKAFTFLGNITFLCNTKMGTPFQRCSESFQYGAAKCRKALGLLNAVCKINEWIEPICSTLKIVDYMCDFVDFVAESVFDAIIKRIDEFIAEFRNNFSVTVSLEGNFQFDTNSSKTLSEIKDNIAADLGKKTEIIFVLSHLVQLLMGYMFTWVVWRVVRYKQKFLSRKDYDNHYLTKDFKDYDAWRGKHKFKTALPLKRKEKKLYIELTSLTLLRKEKFDIGRKAIFLFVSSGYISIIILTDYSLFWVLSTVTSYGLEEFEHEVPPTPSPSIKINVTGTGLMAEMVQSIGNIFTPDVNVFKIDPTPCLPSPAIPDFKEYTKIGLLLLIAWILLIFEPYGWRVRQFVMNRLYPKMAKQRGKWLCNHIIRRRQSFIKWAMREVRQRFRKDSSSKGISFINLLRVKLHGCWICRKILGDAKKICTLCGVTPKCLLKCASPICSVEYCQECFQQLKNTCPICMNPWEYNDMSDISEELDSSLEPST